MSVTGAHQPHVASRVIREEVQLRHRTLMMHQCLKCCRYHDKETLLCQSKQFWVHCRHASKWLCPLIMLSPLLDKSNPFTASIISLLTHTCNSVALNILLHLQLTLAH